MIDNNNPSFFEGLSDPAMAGVKKQSPPSGTAWKPRTDG
jgi:hypothetical protein